MGAAPGRVPEAQLAQAPPPRSFVAATDPRLRFRGRRVIQDAAVRFDWPCTSFKLKTSTSRVWLRMDGARNYFNVLVNASLLCVLKTYPQVRDYPLKLPGPDSEMRVIEVQKRTESRIGGTMQKPTGPVVLHGVMLEDGTLEELEEDTQERRLEFLGDSETSGFGNLGPSQPGAPGLRSLLTVNIAHQDGNQAWPALAAKALDADFHNIAWSGAGVVWNGMGCSADAPFHDLYARALGTSEAEVVDEWQPDAVVIYLGGNDWWSLADKGHDALTEGFHRFLERVRERRAEAAICVLLASPDSICACIGSQEDQAAFAADMSQCWRSAAEKLGDSRVFLDVVAPNPPCSLSEPADWGQMGHWSVQGNKKWAAAVVPILEARLGWKAI
ncbi:unnamed protein product [Effrenium voratum]|nr:unnamed protein product [Effrenium voratum]